TSLEARDAGERRCGAITAAGVLPWMGTSRLLLASEDGPICCVGGDDPLVTQYTSPHRGFRGVAASGATVAAISPDRQRLILWNSWDGRQVGADGRDRKSTRLNSSHVAISY